MAPPYGVSNCRVLSIIDSDHESTANGVFYGMEKHPAVNSAKFQFT